MRMQIFLPGERIQGYLRLLRKLLDLLVAWKETKVLLRQDRFDSQETDVFHFFKNDLTCHQLGDMKEIEYDRPVWLNTKNILHEETMYSLSTHFYIQFF